MVCNIFCFWYYILLVPPVGFIKPLVKLLL
nr:MAG TPA: hypothetical protein [Caudoviricetes sp.]